MTARDDEPLPLTPYEPDGPKGAETITVTGGGGGGGFGGTGTVYITTPYTYTTTTTATPYITSGGGASTGTTVYDASSGGIMIYNGTDWIATEPKT